MPDLTLGTVGVLRELGRRPVTEDEVYGWVGDGTRELVARAIRATGPEVDDAQLDTLNGRFVEHYEATGYPSTRPYPGIEDVLRALRDDGHTLGVVTNKPLAPTQSVLARTGLTDWFATVIGGDTVRKPDPRPLLDACEQLGVARDDAVLVGDSPVDRAAARAAAIPMVLVAWGYCTVPREELGAEALVRDASELLAAVRRLVG